MNKLVIPPSIKDLLDNLSDKSNPEYVRMNYYNTLCFIRDTLSSSLKEHEKTFFDKNGKR